MKNLFYIVILVFIFTSCSNDADSLVVNKQGNLLKSYTVFRNSKGEYSVDYDVVANATSETVKNHASNFNEIYLYSGKFKDRGNYRDYFSLENNQLKIAFNENNTSRKSLIIEDKDIVLARGASESTEFLQSYSITDLGDSTYELSFKVRKGVDVSFSYSDVANVYEVNLREDSSKELTNTFSKVYTKTSKALRIDFVNFRLMKNKFPKDHNLLSSREIYSVSRRPRNLIEY